MTDRVHPSSATKPNANGGAPAPTAAAGNPAKPKISQFNLTTAPSDGTTRLSTRLNLTLSAKNPDAKMIYTYDPISLSAFSGLILLANGTFPSFISNPNNITIIHSTLSMPTPQVLDSDSFSGLKSDLKRKNGLPVKILMDTMVLVKLEKMKSKKVGIRVTCEGIHAPIPKGRAPGLGSNSRLDLRRNLT
nr:NDR1/HIN1-like protein 6 [Ipomoea batatas]GME04399.1 NDR1/HIN1-like protein 6 [Ipomoea batatas]